jgi:DNA-binding MarR family transcriptional regulator
MRQIDQHAEAVREFNRFYTRRIGALGEGHLGSPYSLTEVRVLFELAHRERVTASDIIDTLGLDRGYLSRTLRAFKTRGLIDTETETADRRQTLLRLTNADAKPLRRSTRARATRSSRCCSRSQRPISAAC